MEAKALKFMPGTDQGSKYLAFARKGNVVMGIKVMGVAPGEKFGVPGTTYFAARLRSAPTGSLFAEEDAAKKVVSLTPNPPNLWDAWPGVTWEKKDANRASTTVGVFLKGQFSNDFGVMQQLLEQLKDGKMTSKMTEYLISLVGPNFLVATPEELQAWLETQYAPTVEKIVAAIEHAKKASDAFSEHVGVFGIQAAMLKKAYAQTHADDEESLDADEGETDDDVYGDDGEKG